MVVRIIQTIGNVDIRNRISSFNFLMNYPAGNSSNTPTLFLSRTAVRENFKRLDKALPRVKLHYAVKPNIHPAILEEVHNAGGNFDVCSAGEIEAVLSATSIEAKELLHSHPIKSFDEFDYAINKGIEYFVVDNELEAEKLQRYPDKNLKIIIRFRINVKTDAVVNLQYKFGANTDEVLPIAKKIRESGNIVYGLCFHIGSQCKSPDNYVTAIETASQLSEKLSTHGMNIELLDIGGGFPVEYTEPIMPIEQFCKPINEALDKHVPTSIKIIAEPGRYIVANAVSLTASIIGKANREGKIWYYLDDGLYSTFSGMIYDSCKYPVITYKSGESKDSVISGPTCDSFDVIYDGIMLPEHNCGDKLLFTGVGAYCQVSGSNFNALKTAVYEVID